MRRSSGPWNRSSRHGASRAVSAAATVLLAVLAATHPSPARAANPGSIVIGGGDDPSIRLPPSAGDLALLRWKAGEAARLRGAIGRPRIGGLVRAHPALVPPPCDDCPPVTFVLDSFARQQITGYDCGPATAQVIINQTQRVVSPSTSGESTTTNYRAQSVIADYMGTDAAGSSAWMVKSGLNHFADLDASGLSVPFTVVDISSGSDFHWAMIVATWELHRGAAVPIQMTFSSQHLASWTSATWWNGNKSTTVRHWISVFGYANFWDSANTPTLSFTDSAGHYGGSTGNYTNASRLVFNLSQANSGRIVY